MKKVYISVIILVCLIIITNIPPLKQVIGPDDCRYSNSNGSFTFEETNFGGYDYHLCMNRWKVYKKEQKADTILYRLTSMSPISFWKYGDYLFEKKYRLPYKPWEAIEKIRGPIQNKSGFQDF